MDSETPGGDDGLTSRSKMTFNIHSLLIVRNGHVVTDAYFYPFAEGWLHDLASVTKSFTSSLVGIALNQGYLEGVQKGVLDIFPERTVANVDANKEVMTRGRPAHHEFN